MRQGQQNRRGRGRNNNNSNNNNNNQHRKGQNPLTRSFESTGPDVKLRGTPAHIAEKYIALARDAQSSGDPVLAENYLQHAEHYNRIIMTFREQQMAQGGGAEMQNGMRPARDASGDDPGEDDGEFGGEGQGQPFVAQSRGEGQPSRHEGQSRYEDRGPRQSHEGGGRPFNRDRDRDRPDRGDRDRDRDRGERFQRGDRPDRGDRPERVDRPERAERVERHDRAPQQDVGFEPAAPPRRERTPVPHHEQPEFLRRPVRRPRRETASEETAEPAAPAVEGSGD